MKSSAPPNASGAASRSADRTALRCDTAERVAFLFGVAVLWVARQGRRRV